jgi:hypothetical protein
VSDLIACKRGAVVIMQGCDGIPGKVALDGFEPMAAIIEKPTMEQSVNVQFQTSLAEATYVYVFGDKMGSIMIEGVAFAGRCDGGEVNFEQNGIKDVVDFYNERRASQDSRVLTVTYGPEQLSGFLTGMMLTPRDPLYMLTDFRMVINALPKKGG